MYRVENVTGAETGINVSLMGLVPHGYRKQWALRYFNGHFFKTNGHLKNASINFTHFNITSVSFFFKQKND